MAQQDWFYEASGQRKGPISALELRQMAVAGGITPATLVWREGLSQWSPAKAIRGLFPPDAATPTPTPSPVDLSPSSSPRFAPPVQPLLDAICELPHPLDLVIERLRYAVPDDITAKISRIAALAGVYCIYLAIVLLPLGGLVFAAKVKMWWPLAAVLGAVAGLFVIQFVAHRLLKTLDTAISSNKTILSSFAVPDCAFVLIVAMTIGSAGSIIWSSYSEITSSVLAGVLGILAVGAFSAVVSLQPPTIGVVISEQCRPAEEAVGVATFIMKLAIRCVPIVFATSVCIGTYKVAGLLLYLLRYRGFNEEFVGDVVAAVSLLLCGVALPAGVYLLTLTYYLTLDVISAIVSIPAKLDRIADVSGGGESSP